MGKTDISFVSASGDTSDPWHDLIVDDELQHVLDDPLPSPNKSALRLGEQHAGFDNNTGENWLYPSNMPERAYQLSITQAALYKNTLVVLPTGLGKTFIAAVVMYNMYRWYPNGKIIFMAPTRPLVTQQIEACQRIMPFPKQDTVELTGRIQRAKRTEMWESKRVFFVTPQVVQSDMCSPMEEESSASHEAASFPFKQIKLIVVDEAHRAKGRYAYTEVVQTIAQYNRYFRVLALSATPGRTVEDVAEVVRNLLISHLEVRWDHSVDVLPYVHKRNMKTVVVPLGDNIKTIRDELLEIIDPYLRQLIDANVLSGSLTHISKNFLLFEQKRFRESSQQQRHAQQSAVTSNFSICISLYHALELLERHGLRVFLNNFEEDEEGRSKFVVNMDKRLHDLLVHLREELGPNPFDVSTHTMTNGEIAKLPDNLDFGHPKFEEARHCLLEHFQAHSDSRAIVFCEYRESVMLIYRLLLQHVPLLKPRCFVGQGNNSGSLRALTQKQQLQIMQDFRSGKINILVATCIGEEGIDVGEVELIVCFDISTTNPQRFVQRIGRTGRQKVGNVIMLVTEGREQQILKDVLAHKDSINRRILNSDVVHRSLYKHAPRLVPTEFNPKVLRTFIKPPMSVPSLPTESKAKSPVAKVAKTKKAKASARLKGSQDLRNFFKKQHELTQDHTQTSTQTQKKIEISRHRIDDFFSDFEPPIQTNTQILSSMAPADDTDPFDSEQYRDIQKFISNTAPVLTPKEVIRDPVEQMLSEKLSDEGKRFILNAEPSIVKDVLEKISVIEALENEQDAVIIEEQNVRNLYKVIENLLGGTRAAVEKFVDDSEIEQLQHEHANVHDDTFDVSDSEFQVCFDAIFEGLEDKGLYHDNFDYIQEGLKKTQRYKEFMAKSEKKDGTAEISGKAYMGSMVFETVVVDEETFNGNECINDSTNSFTESKFNSQCRWDDFAKHTEPKNRSTPLHGPLLQAFQRQQIRQGLALSRSFNECANNFQERVIGDDNDVILVTEMETQQNVRQENKTKRDDSKCACKISSPIATHISTKEFTRNDQQQKSPSPTGRVVQQKSPATAEKILSELDIDLEAFMEPFADENENSNDLNAQSNAKKLSESLQSSAEHTTKADNAAMINISTTLDDLSTSTSKLIITHKPTNNTCNSNTSLSSSQKENGYDDYKLTLASPILHESLNASAQKLRLSTLLKAAKCKTPEKLKVALASPQKCNKSPSVFDMYLKNTRGRGRILTLPQSNLSETKTEKQSSSMRRAASESTTSPFAALKSSNFANRGAKRTLHMRSDSSDAEEQHGKESSEQQQSDETECEEIAETQLPKQFRLQQLRKRRRLNEFIDAEATLSGDSNVSGDELDETNSQFLHSLLAASSDEATDVDAPTASQMQAHYLQTIKSPQQRTHGAFKIPNLRVFNDHAEIYSQPPPLEPSQYEADSFVVNESDIYNDTQKGDLTLSPLSRAEHILKQRRRTKKKFKEVATVQRRKRICQLPDSSDEDL